MNPNRLAKAINNIDDDLLIEALDYEPKPKLNKRLILILACLILFTFIATHQVLKTKQANNNCCSCPRISYKDKIYQYTGLQYEEISDDYKLVLTLDENETYKFSLIDFALENGDQIYYSDSHPGEFYIYTDVCNNNDAEYMYFVKQK